MQFIDVWVCTSNNMNSFSVTCDFCNGPYKEDTNTNMDNVPTWVYMVFIAIVYLGIKRCYTRVFNIRRLLVVPVIFILIGLRGTFELFPCDHMAVFYMLFGWLIGLLIGYSQVRGRTIKSDKSKQLIQTPGDISMLIMLLVIFGLEFFIHYAVDAHLAIATSVNFRIFALVVSGTFIGISMGRNATYFYKYLHAESESLGEKG